MPASKYPDTSTETFLISGRFSFSGEGRGAGNLETGALGGRSQGVPGSPASSAQVVNQLDRGSRLSLITGHERTATASRFEIAECERAGVGMISQYGGAQIIHSGAWLVSRDPWSMSSGSTFLRLGYTGSALTAAPGR